MSAPRDKLWYWMNDSTGEIAELEIKLDIIDSEIDALRRVDYEETKARLERLGIDTTNYRPPPRRLASEQRCSNHLRDDDDIGQLVAAAQERPLDRLYREHLARKAAAEQTVETSGRPIIRRNIGRVLGVR